MQGIQCHTGCNAKQGADFVQMLPEFLAQGKHFAAGLGKEVHPEPERYELEAMYGQQHERLTIEQHVNKVCSGGRVEINLPDNIRLSGCLRF